MANDIQDKLKNLSKAEREYALKIMREMSRNGNSQTYKNLLYSDYEEIPVDIETFLKDDRYLGKGLVNSEGKFTIFPYWLETLKKIFPTNIDTAYNTVILTGAIGLGKSQIAVLCQLYLLYRMLCLKDPYIHYGLMPSDKITFSQINVTIDMAKGVAWDKIQQLLQSSSWFMSKGYMSGTTNLQWNPPKGIELIVGSNNNHIMGRAIFCLDGETEILTTTGIHKIADLVDKNINVYSIDNMGNICVSDDCTVIPTIETQEQYEIELEDGTIIRCTPNHKLLLADGTYKEAQYLTPNDELSDAALPYDIYIDTLIKTRGQWGIDDDTYFEGHHIIPKCMGGDGNTKSRHKNIIRLFPEEHYIAHKLLALENPDNPKLVSAWEMMLHAKGTANRDFLASPADYAHAKRLWSSIIKEHNPGIRENGHPWNYGKTNCYTEATLKRMSDSKRGKTHIVSDGTKAKMQLSMQERKNNGTYKYYPSAIRGKVAITNGTITKYVNRDAVVPPGYRYGVGQRKPHKYKNIDRVRKNISLRTSGEKNPMYNNGNKVSGGKNGHATKEYTFNGMYFDCRKSLLTYLINSGYQISNSTFRSIENNTYTNRLYKKHKYIIDNLTWRYKNNEDIIRQ